MLYIEYLFEFMMSALKGLDEENSTKSYVNAILKKLLGIVVITVVLFGLFALALLIIVGSSNHPIIILLFEQLLWLYIIAMLPSTIRTLGTIKTTGDTKYKLMCMLYIVCMMIFGVILQLVGNEVIFGLLDV